MARFAVVEQPDATASSSAPMLPLREVASMLAHLQRVTDGFPRLLLGVPHSTDPGS
jgi:hypothetical protein